MGLEVLDKIIATIVALVALKILYSIISKLVLNGMKFTKFIKVILNKIKILKEKKKGCGNSEW